MSPLLVRPSSEKGRQLRREVANFTIICLCHEKITTLDGNTGSSLNLELH